MFLLRGVDPVCGMNAQSEVWDTSLLNVVGPLVPLYIHDFRNVRPLSLVTFLAKQRVKDKFV